MPAGKYDLTIEQGTTFTAQFTWRIDDGSDPPSGPIVDLTGATARMQIRQNTTSMNFYVELTTENGRITLAPGNVSPNVSLFISSLDTAKLNFATGVYDLEIVTADGIVTRLLKGNVVMDKEVTR